MAPRRLIERVRVLPYVVLLVLALTATYAQGSDWLQLYITGTDAYNGGRYTEGREALVEAWKQAKDFAPLDLRRGLNAYSLGTVFQVQGDLTQADTLLLEAKSIFEAAGVAAQDKLALALDGLGQVRIEQGIFGQAEELFQRALELNRETRGENDPLTALSFRHLGELYAVLNRRRESEDASKRAIAILSVKDSATQPALGSALEGLARLYFGEQRLDEAEALIKQSLESKRQLPDQHPSRADSLLNLAMVYRLKGDPARAQPLLRKALAIYEKAGDPHRLSALAELAGIANDEGKYTTAERCMKDVLRSLQSTVGPDHVSVATAGKWLAKVYLAQGKYAQAEALVERSLVIERRVFGGTHAEVAKSLALLASINVEARQSEAADVHYREAIEVYSRTLSADHPDSVAVHQAYSRFLKSDRK